MLCRVMLTDRKVIPLAQPLADGSTMSNMRRFYVALLASLAAVTMAATPAAAQQPKPNILVIMGDDIGYWNISAYNRGMMGYSTPNIDRIANEGAIFTDYYGQQSCTAGRGAFITGQSPLRTGLLKVGLPAAKEGLSEKDPTIAELLKPQGYATAQFGILAEEAGMRELLDFGSGTDRHCRSDNSATTMGIVDVACLGECSGARRGQNDIGVELN
jgi:hypothetical protein